MQSNARRKDEVSFTHTIVIHTFALPVNRCASGESKKAVVVLPDGIACAKERQRILPENV